MSDQRKDGIAWTDETWNPLRGCSKVSAGCKNCYAEAMAARFSGPGQPYEGTIERGRWNGQIRLVPEKLAEPLRWTRPRRIFVNSMSDLFHEGVPFEYVAAVFGVMAAAPQHVFQVLTKRPKRAAEFFEWAQGNNHSHPETICLHYSRAYTAAPANGVYRWPLPNVWLGVSVEDQTTADERVPRLLDCPAVIRWVSYEPALGPVDFDQGRCDYHGRVHAAVGPQGQFCTECAADSDGTGEFSYGHWIGSDPGLDWIVIGGESGPNARPFDVAWARSTIAQCRAASVACFVKQLGARPFIGLADMPGRATVDGPTERAWPVAIDEIEHPLSPPNRAWRPKFKHHNGGNCDEWPEDLGVREWPER